VLSIGEKLTPETKIFKEAKSKEDSARNTWNTEGGGMLRDRVTPRKTPISFQAISGGKGKSLALSERKRKDDFRKRRELVRTEKEQSRNSRE